MKCRTFVHLFIFLILSSMIRSMPTVEPAYIRHWAKYHSTESCISPTGAVQNAQKHRVTPMTSMNAADINLNDSLYFIRRLF